MSVFPHTTAVPAQPKGGPQSTFEISYFSGSPGNAAHLGVNRSSSDQDWSGD